MPAFPELAGVLGFIRRVKVLGQIEAHQHGHADGNVGVAREVGVDLQRVAEQSHQVFESRVKQRVIEHAVDEVDGDVVAEHNLLDQAVHDPEDGDAELLAAEEVFLVELRDELVGPHDGTGHQLWKETDIEAEVEDVSDRFDAVTIHIHDVADGLEGIERDAHGEQNGIDAEAVGAGHLVADPRENVEHPELRSEEVVHHIGDEVGVLEIEEDGEVDDDAEGQYQVAAQFFLFGIQPFGTKEVV